MNNAIALRRHMPEPGQHHIAAAGCSLLVFQHGAVMRSPDGKFASLSPAELTALRDALAEAVAWHETTFPV